MSKTSKRIAALLSLTSTWGGFEFYHLMRTAEAFSLTAIACAVVSLMLVVFGSYLGRLTVTS